MHTAKNTQGDDLVVLTRAEYEALANDADTAAFDEAKRTSAATVISADDMKAIIAGDLHPLTAWRQAAGLTQTQLARATGVRAATISDIESGKIDPRLSTMKALARELGVDVDDISE